MTKDEFHTAVGEALYNLQGYFESRGLASPILATEIMGFAIGSIRGQLNLPLVDQDLLDAISTGWHSASKDAPIPKPEKGKVV